MQTDAVEVFLLAVCALIKLSPLRHGVRGHTTGLEAQAHERDGFEVCVHPVSKSRYPQPRKLQGKRETGCATAEAARTLRVGG